MSSNEPKVKVSHKISANEGPKIVKLLKTFRKIEPVEHCVLDMLKIKEERLLKLKEAKVFKKKIYEKKNQWTEKKEVWQEKFDKLQSEYEQDKANHEQELNEITKDPKFLRPDQMFELQQEVKEIKKMENKLIQHLSKTSNASFQLECVICLQVPDEKVFICSECENAFCKICKETITKCGVCRVPFAGSAPKRSRLAERLLANKM